MKRSLAKVCGGEYSGAALSGVYGGGAFAVADAFANGFALAVATSYETMGASMYSGTSVLMASVLMMKWFEVEAGSWAIDSMATVRVVVVEGDIVSCE